MGYRPVEGTQEVKIYNTEETKDILGKVLTKYTINFGQDYKIYEKDSYQDLKNRIYMEFKQAIEYNRALADQEAKESIVEGLESLLEVL